ncbi:hypothetical protein PGTUg99_017935 [Puccinia graminis f. sp. tritici]|uniref:Uncharacterized protein n=1 Tax=Puccinia graminis f. sp. tritici TaxID=56615 RepID=A0A5B0SJ85_PUCGR|nr:hypothetical protein PGTUg99_017935 [Puccinia graminis f. sp. tritici]
MASASDIQAIIAAALEQQSKNLEAQLATRDEAISKLMAKASLIDDSPKSSKTKSNTPKPGGSSKSNSTPINKGKASTAQGLGTSKSATPKKSNHPSPRNTPSSQQRTPSSQQKTPSSHQKSPSNQRKRSVTPKTKSPPANPLQMITKNMPESFSQTRDALYAHIKIIWNLLEQKTIPGPPPSDSLREFNSRFSDANEIEQTAENTNAPSLIPVKDIQTLKSLKLGRRKVGKGLVHLEDFFVEYTQATLARLGLRIWAPDLEDSPDSLYNEACRQAALKTFRQAACSDAYAYMNINKNHAKNLQLLIPTYNHYVHFLQKNRYEREKKEVGKFRANEERKVIGRARDRLRDARLKFALGQKLPKRYQNIIADVNSHSDDEYDARNAVYIIKTLKFRSANATKFFRRLDAAMLQADELDRKRVQRRKRVVPPTVRESIFPRPPKGLPLDFYDPTWFNNLLTQQRIEVADTRQVAFLPDAAQSLMGKQIPSEKLTDKQFTAKFFDTLAAPYDLTHEIENEDDDENETEEEDNGSYAGEEIDLNDTSGGDDDDEEDVGEEDRDFVDEDMQDGEEEDFEGDEEEDNEPNEQEDSDAEGREARYNAMVLDDDANW